MHTERKELCLSLKEMEILINKCETSVKIS